MGEGIGAEARRRRATGTPPICGAAFFGANRVVGAAWEFTPLSFGSGAEDPEAKTRRRPGTRERSRRSSAEPPGGQRRRKHGPHRRLSARWRCSGRMGVHAPECRSVYTQQEKLIAKAGTESGAGESGKALRCRLMETALVGGYGDDGYVGGVGVDMPEVRGGLYPARKAYRRHRERDRRVREKRRAVERRKHRPLGGYGDNGGAGAAGVFLLAPRNPIGIATGSESPDAWPAGRDQGHTHLS